MSSSHALVSWVASSDDAFRTDHLKLCCLWYDEVLLETLREDHDDCSNLIERLVKYENNSHKLTKKLSDAIVPLANKVGPSAFSDLLKEGPKGYPRWGERGEKYTYPEPENPEQYAHNHLLSLLEREHGIQRFDGWEVEQAEGRARVAVDAVLLWERVNTSLPCMLQADAFEREAMIAMQQFQSGTATSVDPLRLLELAVPSLAEVTWEKILELRNSSDLELMKKKVREAAEQAGSDLNRAREILQNCERDAIEFIVEFGRPNVKKIAIESSIANIPGALFNPYSLYVAGRDTAAAIKHHEQVGWLYMLRDIRSATEREDTRILPI